MADYNNIKDYKQLYYNLWNEMHNKVEEMQNILAKADELSSLLQYQNKDSDFKIHTINMSSLFNLDKKE